jgi:pimeloyl-ACP methyl ester carboxylesterase
MHNSKPLLASLALFICTALAASKETTWISWDYQGDAVAYRLDGAGPPVLQVHGIGAGASSAQTEYQIPALVDAGYRVYSIDLLGWGRSIGPQRRFTGPDYVALINAFLDEVIAEPTALIGHSLGGTYAIGVAAQNPQQVTALVLNAPVGAVSFTDEPGRFNELIWKWFVTGTAGQAAYAALGSWPSLRFFCRSSLYVDPSFCDVPTIFDYWRFTQQPDSIYAAASFLTGNLALDVRTDFTGLQQPVLLIWGLDNVLTPVTEGYEFVALNPTAALVEVSPGGAMVNDERRDLFNALLIDHLDTHHR